jgi:F-type H+-transporting ATPase subunit b
MLALAADPETTHSEVGAHAPDATDAHGGSLLQDTNLWVTVAFLIVVGILVWQRVPKMIAAALNKHGETIQQQLDEARTLREDAQRLLADYQKRQRDAENEASEIIEQARRDAQLMAAEARRKLDEQLTRRRKAAEDRIARAEAQAIAEVRGKAAELAIAAAREIIVGRVDERAQHALLDRAIADIRTRLN